MIRRVCLLSAAFALVATGCPRNEVELGSPDTGVGIPDDGGVVAIPGLMELRVEPPTASIMDDGVDPASQVAFRAIGRFADGERDLTDEVTWALSNDRLGAVDDGLFTTKGVGGSATVDASSTNVSAQAEVTVFVDATRLAPDVPPDAPSLFPADTSSDSLDRELAIIYPADATRFPPNVNHLDIQWVVPDEEDLFELSLDSSVARIRLYAVEPHFVVDAEVQAWIAQTHAGRSVQMVVRAVEREDREAVLRSEPVSISFTEESVIGAVYYWSTGSKGVMRSVLSANSAARFYPDPETGDDKCASCHTVARNGRRISMAYDGERLRVVNVEDRATVVPQVGQEGAEYGWGTFNPAADQLLYANKGVLSLVDLQTGAANPLDLPLQTFATHPDWSPDGTFVAVALSGGEAPKNKEVKGSSLARMGVRADGTLEDPVVLLQSEGPDDTIYFPSISPDSRWIAFVRGEGKSKDNETSELFLMRADGSEAPILLERLNRVVGKELQQTEIGNSMPTWAPNQGTTADWIAFSSLRNYGAVLEDTQKDQLWAAAVDLDRAAVGQDPSFPAFWLTFQDLAEGNHRAFWTLAPEDICPSTIEICDSLDNDCDGIVDEDCCTVSTEICGDVVDNDCDGAIDEACGCSDSEICGNNLDDDCDELVDLDDEDCEI